ncbi:hypothetical protein [Paenibacillus sp. NPDC058177]
MENQDDYDLTLFIDILADMICHYLQTVESTNEADNLVSQSHPDAA